MATAVAEVLEQEHGRIADLFEKVSDPDCDRPVVLQDLVREIVAHIASERAEVLPEVKSRGIGGDDLPGGLKYDYDEIERLLVLIERRTANSPDMPELVTELKDAVETHMERCRSHLVPGLRQSLSAGEQEELGRKITNADQMVVSHPHPHLLSLGPLSNKLTALLARFDFLRDKTVKSQGPPPET